MRAKSSPVWNYFSYSGFGKYAECTLCKKKLSLGSEIKKRQTTFGLKRHLDYGHQVDWEIQSELNKPEKSTLDSDLILKESSPDFTEKLNSEITDDLIVDKIPQKLNILMQSGNISVTHEKIIMQNNHEERNSSDFTEKINFEHLISLTQNNITVFKNKSKVFQPSWKEAVNRNSNSICHANNFKKCINEDHDEFKKARKNQEDDMKNFICHICQEKFEHHAFQVHFSKCTGKQENLQVVIKNVHEGQIFSETCDKSFSNPGDLRTHVSQIDEEKGKCNVCGKVFPVHLKLHMKVHEGQTLCQTCGKSFPNPGDLRNHVSLVHEEKGKCKVCGKYFSTPKNMRRHVEIVHEKIKNATCDHCGKLFSEKGGLKKHLNAYHYQSYKCETCQKYYYSQNSLNNHIHVVHEGHKDYSCESCGKLFAEAQHLKRHIRGVHEGIKNHKCNTCGRAFFKKFSLQGHIRTVHEKLRDHICAYCTKAYSTAQHLRKHISVHEGQKRETTFMIVDV